MKAFIAVAILLVQEIVPVFMSSSSESAENLFRAETIIQSIIEEENELISKEDRQQKVKPRTPQYPIELLKQFESSLKSNRYTNSGNSDSKRKVTLKVNNHAYTKPRDRLFHVWLPAEIIETEISNRTAVRFQQTLSKHYFGNFTSIQITLTKRDDIQLSPTTYLKMFTKWENDALQYESIQTLNIKEGKKYHSFDITKFISARLKNNMMEPYFIEISFQAYETNGKSLTNNKLDFSRLFDVQVDMPLIVFFYGDFLPLDADLQSVRRKRRSAVKRRVPPRPRARPSSQCQRRSFSVKPAEVDWNDVVTPTVLDLGYCSGSCPFPLEDQYYNYTFHSFLIDRFRLHHVLRAPSDLPHSTCVPLSYKPVSVIETVGVDQISAGVIYNLSVESCGCR